MHVPPLHSHHTDKLLASSGLLKRLASAIGASVVFLVGVLCPTLSHGQVTPLSTTTGVSTTTAAITIAHTTSAASNRLMLVGISHTKDDPTINSVTYGGVALTALGTAQASDFRTRIYSLIAPASGTANVVVTFSARPSKGAIVTVSTYSGVNQTTPLGTLAAASGDSATPSVAVTSVSGDLVHDVLTTETGSGTITAGAGQTLNGTAPADVEIVRNRSSRETATGTTTTMSYSMTAKKWSISGVAIKRSPEISVSGTLAAVNTTFGSASPSPSSFTISGANMAAGITVAPPTGFQVSTALGSGYATSIVVGGSGTIAPTSVFVRLAASTNAGTYSGNVTLSSTGATSQTIATASSVVSKATPTVTTVPSASSITFGQTLASSTLSSGVGSVAGSFTFTTPSTAPNAGTAAQGFTFTPTNSANYNNAAGTVNVTVAKANPTVTTPPTASSITFGQTLASSTLSGGVGSVAGSFTFTTPSTAPNAGTAAQGFTFTPTDSANYNAATGTVNVAVSPRALTITAGAASKASGAADPTLTYSSDGLLAGGSITGSLARASGETTGSYPITQGTLSAGSNYTISFTGANFFITGLMAMADSIQKPGTISALKIPVADLLANDGTLGATGEVVPAPNLTVTAAQTSLGAPLAIRGQFILFLPATTGEETLTYTVSNGTATATATVTLTGEASAPSFSLEVIKRGTAAFSGGSTSVTHDFLGVPNLTYRIQYSTDLSSWTTAPDQSSGSTGSFSVTFTQSGDFAASWNSQMFFRATKP
jgi:hypothetical protein